MTATNHVLTGLVIGTVVHQPALAIPLAFASHFVCDALPHFGFGKAAKDKLGTKRFSRYLLTDCSAAAALLLLIFAAQPASWLLMLACGVAAASPDLMWLPGYLRVKQGHKRFLKKNAFMRFHSRIQWSESTRGLWLEAGWFVIMGWLLLSQAS